MREPVADLDAEEGDAGDQRRRDRELGAVVAQHRSRQVM